MKKYQVSGFIKNIKYNCPKLSLVTIIPLKRGMVEEEIPFYDRVPKEFLGKFVTIITEREGFFRKTFHQKIEGLNNKIYVSCPYFSIKEINKLEKLTFISGNKLKKVL